MDVRFCARQEPLPRGIYCTLRVLQALYRALSRAPQEDPCLLLTKTYMEVAKPEKYPRKRAMQLEKCRILRLRAMLAIASFIAAFPTSHIMSEKPTFSIPVSRSGEKRGVDCLNTKGNFHFERTV